MEDTRHPTEQGYGASAAHLAKNAELAPPTRLEMLLRNSEDMASAFESRVESLLGRLQGHPPVAIGSAGSLSDYGPLLDRFSSANARLERALATLTEIEGLV